MDASYLILSFPIAVIIIAVILGEKPRKPLHKCAKCGAVTFCEHESCVWKTEGKKKQVRCRECRDHESYMERLNNG